MGTLSGKKGLVVGIANEHSIAYGCAEAFRAAGAELAITYRDERAEATVRPLGEKLDSPLIMPCNVERENSVHAVFERIRSTWGRLDFLLHAVAYARKADLHGRVVDCSEDGFTLAMTISCYSFIRMAKLAEPLMAGGGCLLTVSNYGAEIVLNHYNIMGPTKAALEAVVRYMAAELGPGGIRVNALSAGPLQTRAASGIDHFDELIEKARAKAPEHRLVTIDDVGAMAAFLVGDEAAAITGGIHYVDAGYHVVD